jgi:glutathione synthase/RimK-type ligase-like ATP-grasp enzyme
MKHQKVKLLILRNEDEVDFQSWVKACESYADEVDFSIVDLTRNDWLEQIQQQDADYLLAKPSCKTSQFRQLYQERIEILVDDLNYGVFPSLDEIRIYENKRYIAGWLKAMKLPHPKTDVFYHKKEAVQFIRNAAMPIVGKMNIGASGNGVQVLKTTEEALEYIEKAFGQGITNRTGPKLGKGKLVQRAWRKLTHPKELKSRLKVYQSVAADVQKGFVIFQEFVPHEFEWRVVRIGDSFFAHKKLKVNEKASGTLLKGYDNPPLKLFDYVKSITDQYGFYSQAVDIFETPDGDYLLNELQCIFGQSDPYQMLVDGEMGRYVYKKGNWFFEPGDFNQNQSYNLRVEYVLEKIREKNQK